MQRRTHHYCPVKMIWAVKRSLFKTYVAVGLSLSLLFTLFLVFGHQNWRPLRGMRVSPVACMLRGFHGPKVDSCQNSSSQSLLKKKSNVLTKLSLSLSAQQPKFAVNENSGDTMGRGNVMSSKNGLEKHMDIEGKLSAQPYHFILNEPLKCKDNTPFLIFLIMAEPGKIDARNAIRQTWGNESLATGLGLVRLFLLGIANSALQSRIVEESQIHHDIIQQDYQDTYHNLTIKTLTGMNWVATFCPNASYVMKTDSDVFVNTEYLIKKLLRPDLPPKQKYFTGYLIHGGAPQRRKSNKWYMPREMYPKGRYPLFCSGTGYVFSGDLANLICQVSLSIPKVHLEDVYVGMCLAKLRIDPQPPPNKFLFNIKWVPYKHCRYRQLITSHPFRPSEMVKYWNRLQRDKRKACISS